MPNFDNQFQEIKVSEAQFAALLAKLTPLSRLPVPPMLLEALGYYHYNAAAFEHRYISLYESGERPSFDDGSVGSDCSIESYLAFVRNPYIYAQLAQYGLGFSGSSSHNRLLLDRLEGKWYVGGARLVRTIVQVQYFVGMTVAEYERLLEQERAELQRAQAAINYEEEITQQFVEVQTSPLDAAAIRAYQARQKQLYDELRGWLDEHCPVAPPKATTDGPIIIIEQGGNDNGQQN